MGIVSPLDALGLGEDGDKGRKAEPVPPRMDCVAPCIPRGLALVVTALEGTSGRLYQVRVF